MTNILKLYRELNNVTELLAVVYSLCISSIFNNLYNFEKLLRMCIVDSIGYSTNYPMSIIISRQHCPNPMREGSSLK